MAELAQVKSLRYCHLSAKSLGQEKASGVFIFTRSKYISL